MYLYTDGGSRGNPGIAGCGAVVIDNNGKELGHIHAFLGVDKTNNYAEYHGVIFGLELLHRMGINPKDVVLRTDSMLLVNQYTGKFKVRNDGLRPLHAQIAGKFRAAEHVYRKHNAVADQLANVAMNTRETSCTIADS